MARPANGSLAASMKQLREFRRLGVVVSGLSAAAGIVTGLGSLGPGTRSKVKTLRQGALPVPSAALAQNPAGAPGRAPGGQRATSPSALPFGSPITSPLSEADAAAQARHSPSRALAARTLLPALAPTAPPFSSMIQPLAPRGFALEADTGLLLRPGDPAGPSIRDERHLVNPLRITLLAADSGTGGAGNGAPAAMVQQVVQQAWEDAARANPVDLILGRLPRHAVHRNLPEAPARAAHAVVSVASAGLVRSAAQAQLTTSPAPKRHCGSVRAGGSAARQPNVDNHSDNAATALHLVSNALTAAPAAITAAAAAATHGLVGPNVRVSLALPGVSAGDRALAPVEPRPQCAAATTAIAARPPATRLLPRPASLPDLSRLHTYHRCFHRCFHAF